MPPADIDIDTALVRTLLRTQHPDLADFPIESFDAGWDNAIFRLGDHLGVRLPRRKATATLLANEQRWLPTVAKSLPLPVPTALRIGVASPLYPSPWSVTPWLAGVTADESRLRSDQGTALANFLKALHSPAPPQAPRNAHRGVALKLRAPPTEERMERLQPHLLLIPDLLRCLWRRALDAPIDVVDTWIHGDLHARNVLVTDGEVSGIIDWGDMCQGDRATDLAAIWMLLHDADARAAAMIEYGGSTGTWARARGWAVFFGLILLDIGLANRSGYARMGEMTLRNLTSDLQSEDPQ